MYFVLYCILLKLSAINCAVYKNQLRALIEYNTHLTLRNNDTNLRIVSERSDAVLQCYKHTPLAPLIGFARTHGPKLAAEVEFAARRDISAYYHYNGLQWCIGQISGRLRHLAVRLCKYRWKVAARLLVLLRGVL